MIDESFTGHCPTCGQSFRGWRLIDENTPRDGSEIDLWFPKLGRITNAEWGQPSAHDVKHIAQWVADISADGWMSHFQEEPTHWMPLFGPSA